MIIWGYKGYKKELGHTPSAIQCGNCQQTAPWDLIETGRKFSLYWIPLIPYGRKYYVLCPVCEYGKEIEKQDINEYLNY